MYLFLFTTLSVWAQKKSEVLLTIDNSPVYTSEFKRVYQKNLELVQDESQKNIDDYLQLFIDYKIKVAEAYAQNLHEGKEYKKEFSSYQNQLSRNYILENKVTEGMALEAYERGQEQINAAHILILAPYDASPQDTLAAFNKIKEVRRKAISGEDFETLAKTYSEEPGAAERGGNLGYFSVFTMVYPFETAAYHTKEGEISDIVRTTFGYHIIKVLDRKKKEPEITVSHIMILENQANRTFEPKERINELSKLIAQGRTFESIAEQYSDDKASAKKGGKLVRFGKGDLRSKLFEEAAYALKNPGDISEPIQSEFGWHIIRLDEKHPLTTFEEEKAQLEKRVTEGDRSKQVSTAVNNLIKKKYGFTLKNDFAPFFNDFVTEDILTRKWKYEPLPADKNKTIFTIGKRDITYNDFAAYISEKQLRAKLATNKNALVANLYEEFETEMLKQYMLDELENENEEYAAVIKEYRDGLLIFDVMSNNVWEKARKDTLELKKFYEQHKMEHTWQQRLDAAIVSANTKEVAEQVKAMFKDGKDAEAIKATLNKNNEIQVIVAQGIFEKDARELPQGFTPSAGVSKVYPQGDSFTVVHVKEVLPQGIKSFEEVRGKIISDYQNQLEENWIKSLRKKYKVEVKDKALKKVKKELQS